MNRPQIPQPIPPNNPLFQPKGSGIFLSTLMRDLPPHISPEQAQRYITTTIVNEFGQDTGLFVADCGCRLTREDILRSLKVKGPVSWTYKFVCSNHQETCSNLECARALCIRGNPDGYGVKSGDGKIAYYCTDHYRWAKFWQNWDDFWGGFFGGES